MSNHLLSLLSEIEHAVAANDSLPDGAVAENSRVINFHQGLARLTLAVRPAVGALAPRGAVLVQNYILADGSLCVKAHLSWPGTEKAVVHIIYGKPGTNWKSEAGQIAVKWLDGLVADGELHELPENPADTSMATATA